MVLPFFKKMFILHSKMYLPDKEGKSFSVTTLVTAFSVYV